MYSFSTCWNSHRHTNGREMLEEIRDLGFKYAELSHGIRLSLVPGIMEAAEAGVIQISTLHNFCPLPIGCNHANPNLFKFSSTNSRERDNAYKHTMKTIEMADRLGAKLIVLHMGEIDMRNYTDKLIALLEAGKVTAVGAHSDLLRESAHYRHVISSLEDDEARARETEVNL